MDCGSMVSKDDALALLEIINDCLSCNNVSDAHCVMAKTARLMDFSNAVYAMSKFNSQGTLDGYQTLNFSYPVEWLEIYRKGELHKRDPIVLENLSDCKPQYWADTYKKHKVDKDFLRLSEDFRLSGGYASGVINRAKSEGCLLSFAGNMEKHPRNGYLLHNLTPHLHSAFANVLSQENKPRRLLQITIREKQVLNWVKHGKTTWDISMILDISERTVKFHVDNIMRKLDAVSRTHAVAIALAEGLIDVA